MISTTGINCISAINKIFTDNGITFRRIDYHDGILYLCKTPFGQTFNVQLKNNKSIRIWSFIGTSSIDMVGAKYECAKYGDTTLGGVEITDDGDLSFYLTDVLTLNKTTNREKLQNMITTYVNIVSRISIRSFKL